MRRLLLPVRAYAAAVLAAAACRDSTVAECFESGASAYRVSAGGDTSQTFRWQAANQPVRVYAEPTPSLPANVDSSLALWIAAFRCHELAIVRVADSNVADIVIGNPSQMPPNPFPAASFAADSVGACQGRTDIQDTLGRIQLPIRTYVTPASVDSAAVEACYHFVTAHEIGHTLGIFAHSPNPGDLMYAVPFRRVLTPNDRYSIQLLYHLDHVGIGVIPRP